MSALNRAYSFFEIKQIDEDERVIEGVASTPTPDRMQDVVQPLGAKFALPIPYLWQHRSHEPIGHVIDAKPTKYKIPFRAKIQKTEELGRLKDRLDEAWQSLKLRLVSANSIGFRPIKWSFLESGGVDYEEWDWMELSAVTIPAQPDAVITAIKSFDRIFREAEGVPEAELLTALAPKILAEQAAAPLGKQAHVVRLNAPAPAGAPFVIKRINHRR